MRLGLTLPIFDELADPELLAELAAEAEAAGWDAVFLWDHVRYRPPARAATDPWIALAAIAVRTQRILLGPMVTPLARRRPHIVARQLVALDQLSSGRVVFGAGLGLDRSGEEFARFGEQPDLRTRAAMLDESLDVVTGLLSGEPVDHHGEHFTVADVQFLPAPVHGRIPIWIAARWPNARPLQRAARYDGVYVIDITPPDLPRALEAVAAQRAENLDGYDVIVHDLPGADPRPWAESGATWMLTTLDPFSADATRVRAAIHARPDA